MRDFPLVCALIAATGAYLGADRLQRYRKEQSGKGLPFLFPLLMLLSAPRLSAGQAALGGVAFALGYTSWMLWKLLLPRAVSAVLAASQILTWTLFALGAWRLWHLPFPANILLISSWGAVLFWLEWTLLPLWGTAQSFACSSATSHPLTSAVGALAGVWSGIWMNGLGGLLILAVGHPAPFYIAGAVLIATFGADAALGALLFPAKNDKTLRVAIFGWAGTGFDGLTEIPAAFQDAAREASDAGARLLVTPEAAIHVANRAYFRVALQTLALKYRLALAVGYFDAARNENCIDFISADGEVAGRYVKTHLVPLVERYAKGRGEVALMDVDGVRVGGLICQDDNFPDIARRYARAGAQLLVVPTNDWARVKNIHFANHLWRALEFRFALARAASDGISALTSFEGKVEKSSDHFQDGAKLLVADVLVGNGKPTLYAKYGDWFPVACGLAAVVGLWLAQ